MKHKVVSTLSKASNTLLFAVCAVVISHAALAAPIAGCDPVVMKALEAKAQAKVAADVATTDEIIKKPDSVLAMTCFNQAAGVSAQKGGQIFSGDFTTSLTPIISDALQNFYPNFNGSLAGTSPLYSQTALSPAFNCTGMQDVWTEVATAGVPQTVGYSTFDDLRAGTPPAGAGTDFLASWNAAKNNQQVFSNLNSAVAALPVPTVPNFSAATGSCDVLMTAGIVTACP
jgi:hypothetical protein